VINSPFSFIPAHPGPEAVVLSQPSNEKVPNLGLKSASVYLNPASCLSIIS